MRVLDCSVCVCCAACAGTALVTIRREIADMTVRVGVVTQLLMDAKARAQTEKRNGRKQRRKSSDDEATDSDGNA